MSVGAILLHCVSNFLFIVSGWFWGFILLHKYVKPENAVPQAMKQDVQVFLFFTKLLMWTFSWIWICLQLGNLIR